MWERFFIAGFDRFLSGCGYLIAGGAILGDVSLLVALLGVSFCDITYGYKA